MRKLLFPVISDNELDVNIDFTTPCLHIVNVARDRLHLQNAIICDSPVIRQCHPGYLSILTAHCEEEQRQDVTDQRGAEGKLGCSHDVQFQPLH